MKRPVYSQHLLITSGYHKAFYEGTDSQTAVNRIRWRGKVQ